MTTLGWSFPKKELTTIIGFVALCLLDFLLCLCVGNAERNEVPNHNSTYIRSEKEVEAINNPSLYAQGILSKIEKFQ